MGKIGRQGKQMQRCNILRLGKIGKMGEMGKIGREDIQIQNLKSKFQNLQGGDGKTLNSEFKAWIYS